ncbi:gastrula zinc finger protein XlCGF17.1-like [Trichoplusia ni]|uniref:Gastrula zinc finger protein XlCGF17.1-like n=1 Tax=Trichoplusia ni TaxID=7111 RepID=A0A7E5WVN0_TRINI|nr:gastrula zinc finger protein XlCGF17.1-like [Trichoplusia ni]XP_026744890.1 gastrula zinc finger protein XlCGF17.1-like [Trichoplusia ni]
MVGALLLLKMLHCKQVNDNKTSAGDYSGEGTSQEEKPREIKVKNEHDEDNICRVCLKEGSIPIYGSGAAENILESLITFGGIEVKIDDNYPKFLCQPCNALLQGAILFRKTAQESDELLKRPPEEPPITEVEFLENDDNFSEYERKIKSHRTYRCKKCVLTFDSFKDYTEHRLSEEHENMRVTCPVCNNSYTALYFKKHLALHNQEPSHICDICGKNFLMQGQFTRHRLTHFYKLPFKCSLCPYKGRFRESLKMHMRTHTGEKPYQCTQCPSRFINKSNLNKHVLTHKGEHEFKCDFCGRGFYTHRELDLHYQVDHIGIKDHVCNICGKAFGYRKQMMKHQLKVHKREKLKSGRMPLYLKVQSMQQQGQDISIES